MAGLRPNRGNAEFHVDNAVANARLEGQHIRPEAIELGLAYARGEIDRDTYLARASANIDDLRRQLAQERAHRAVG